MGCKGSRVRIPPSRPIKSRAYSEIPVSPCPFMASHGYTSGYTGKWVHPADALSSERISKIRTNLDAPRYYETFVVAPSFGDIYRNPGSYTPITRYGASRRSYV